jgi:glycosyltransferase involved in cell wall biosynthesis
VQKVSIVTISFNQAEYLEEAIRSVLSQDYSAIEYIVVDPGSTDGSRDIIERYRDRIAKVIYYPDKGPADGLNRGFSFATGTIFAYLNADDVLLPGTVSKAVHALERTGSAVVFGDGYFTDGESKVIRRCFSSNFSARSYVIGSAVIMQQSSFWRSEWHHKIGGFNLENRTCWDGEFFFKVALAGGKLRHIREYWSCFRIHDKSITGTNRVRDEYLAWQQQMLGPHVQRYGRLLPLLRAASRLAKFITDPRIVAYRVRERIFGPPTIAK